MREKVSLGAVAFIRLWVLAHTPRHMNSSLALAEGAVLTNEEMWADTDAWVRARQRATLAWQRVMFAPWPINVAATERVNYLITHCVECNPNRVLLMNYAIDAVMKLTRWQLSIGLRRA